MSVPWYITPGSESTAQHTSKIKIPSELKNSRANFEWSVPLIVLVWQCSHHISAYAQPSFICFLADPVGAQLHCWFFHNSISYFVQPLPAYVYILCEHSLLMLIKTCSPSIVLMWYCSGLGYIVKLPSHWSWISLHLLPWFPWCVRNHESWLSLSVCPQLCMLCFLWYSWYYTSQLLDFISGANCSQWNCLGLSLHFHNFGLMLLMD